MTNRLDRDFHLPGLLRFALPTIIMMLVVSLYTIVDGVLIARLVGENALAAANVAYPAISFTLAMGIMLGTGGSAVVAHKMGPDIWRRPGGTSAFWPWWRCASAWRSA